MAVLDDVVLVADGGDVTVGRQTATFVYGEFNVVLPHGREQVETDDRLQDGYVYRPKGGIKGPFDVGFVRADATVDLEADTSDVEVVVDSAQKQVEGDVFFERDISSAGLGQFVLDRDFRVGDVVTVELWGKRLRLPVTAGDYVASESEGPAAARVHVGGQLISDAESVARQNGDLRRQIAREKAERMRQVSSESSARRAAVAGERSAREADVAQVREVLGGAQADEQSLVAQLAAVQAQITGMVGDGESPPPPGLLNSYLWMNTRLWEAQQVIDEAQNLVAEQQSARQAEQGAIVDTLQSQLGQVSGRVWQVGADGDGTWLVNGSNVMALGSWVGAAVLDVTYFRRTDSGITYPRETRWVEVGTNRTWGMPGDVTAGVFHYQKRGGSVTRMDKNLAGFVADASWTSVRTVAMEVDRVASMALSVNWSAVHRGAFYGVRITVDGVVVAESSSTSFGPLGPLGSGYRTQSVSKNVEVRAGQTVRFEVRCDHKEEQQRTAASGNTRLWWVED